MVTELQVFLHVWVTTKLRMLHSYKIHTHTNILYSDKDSNSC